MHYVLVLMAVAIVVILVCVVVVATGRGGEMAHFPNDYAPPDFGALAATDVALLRPPAALWGYNMQATDEALSGIASAISARDVRIASLERQLADLRAAARSSQHGAPGPPASGSAQPSRGPYPAGAPPGTGHQAADRPGLADATPARQEHPAARNSLPGRRPDAVRGESASAGTGWPERAHPQTGRDPGGAPPPQTGPPVTRPQPDEEETW